MHVKKVYNLEAKYNLEGDSNSYTVKEPLAPPLKSFVFIAIMLK